MPNDDTGSRRIGTPTPPAGATDRTAGATDRTVVQPPVHDHVESTRPAPDVQPAARPAPATEDLRPARAAKTSAAAVFGLVFGLAALFCALTALLSPAAIVFGIIGLVLAAVGIKMAKKPGVTGRGVAIGGLVTAALGLIIGGVILGGLAAVVNDDAQLDRIQGYLDDARDQLPSTDKVRDNVPGQ